MAKGKKINLSTLNQTHGALAAPLSIEELTGQVVGYSVSSLDEYRQLLSNMSDEEMHEHAVDVAGVVPVSVRSLLIDRLETKFISASRRSGPIPQPTKISESNQEFQRRFMGGTL